ncbi:hypothetical protein MTO96_018646 [Rhipicephalus appendiculatus]
MRRVHFSYTVAGDGRENSTVTLKANEIRSLVYRRFRDALQTSTAPEASGQRFTSPPLILLMASSVKGAAVLAAALCIREKGAVELKGGTRVAGQARESAPGRTIDGACVHANPSRRRGSFARHSTNEEP